ncbi:MAG: GDSL-type esterase/lipase family protein [Negativibacillus sp.]|nr:GDSL-type esterase/lipase family protein [Negativibacillus sp.]
MRGRTSIYSHRRKNRKKSLLIFLAVLLLAAALALGVSAYWGKMQEKNEQQTAQAQAQGEIPKEVLSQEQLEESSPTEDSIQSNPTPSQEQPEKQENPVAEEKQPEPSQPDVTELTSERILSSAALVPNSGSSVGDEYFDDAAFVGDSITEGIKLYEVMTNATVVAARGINLDNVFTDDQIRTAQGNSTVMGALEAAAPKKIYIMFGANGVGWFTEQHFTDVYTEFVQAVKEQHPDSQIYLQSILPVTQEFDDSREDISNDKINRYNELVVEIAEEQEVHYLDVASTFKDEKGCLPEDSNGDGMHFGNKYYQKWFDYLKSHTAAEE